MEIREIRPEEHDALAAVTLAAYKAVPGGSVSEDYEKELLDVASRAAGAIVLVAVDGGVVGGVTYVPGVTSAYAEFDDLQAAGIRMLAVDPQVQRRGVGTALVRACIDRARASGRTRIVLHSTLWMRDAHRLYERVGFARRADLDWRPLPAVYLAAYVYELG